MAALYNLEPQPTAKVILRTTSGDLTLELFAKQTPLTSRNFLQHCLDGYYTNTIFHRLVPGFIIQGGDPTGTGSGGISAINEGDVFQDEFHSRLKFNRRGLLGMANEGKDSNGSQFFLTLGVTAELQGKNTMFGRIEGDTIYNLMKMGDAELAEGEGSERPLYPTKITGTEVLVNPFEDMVARAREAPRSGIEEGKKEVKKRKKPAGKNVLSFGGGEEGEEVAPVLKRAKVNPKLVVVEDDEPAVKEKSAPKKKKKEQRKQVEEDDIEEQPAPSSKTVAAPEKAKPVEDDNDVDEDMDSEPEDNRKPSRTKLDTTNAEIAALKASMKRTVDPKFKEKEKPKSALESLIPETSTRGRKRGKVADERGAIDLFKAFKQRLETLPVEEAEESAAPKPAAEAPTSTANGADEAEDDDEAALCDLHFIANCQSCKSWDEGDKPDGEANGDGEDDPGWMAHKLSFAKDTLGKDLEWKRKMEEIEVIDPREKARAIKEEGKKSREKGKGKEKEKEKR